MIVTRSSVRELSLVLPFLALIFLAARPLGAATLYSNLAATPPIFGGGGFTTEDSFGWAASFVPTATGNVDSVELPMDNEGGTTINGVVSIYSDASGAPGTLLETLDATPDLQNTATLETADSSVNSLLDAGTPYWLVVFTSGTENGIDDGTWLQNNTGATSTVDETEGTNASFGVLEVIPGESDPAFEVDGTSAAPEPSTLGIGLAGLAALALLSRRTRSNSAQ